MIKDKILSVKPPRIAAGLLVAAFVSHLIWPARVIPRSFGWLGAVSFFGGFVLMTWARNLFKSKETPICPSDTPTCCILGGPYRFTRNPMYLGMLLMLLGIGMWVRSVPFFLPPLAMFTVLNFVFIPMEEEKMAKLFSYSYLDYKSRIRRWI